MKRTFICPLRPSIIKEEYVVQKRDDKGVFYRYYHERGKPFPKDLEAVCLRARNEFPILDYKE